MPWYLPFRTAFGRYIYDVPTNSIITVSDELFEHLCRLQGKNCCNSSQLDALSSRAKEELAYLNETGYLLDSPLEKIEHPQSESIENQLERQVPMLILQITQRCNFRCAYCVYSSDNQLNRAHSSAEMSYETACKAIDFLYEHSIDCAEVGVSFYGGEPLLNFALVKSVVEYADAKFEGKTINYRMTTNASLLSEEVIKFFMANNRKFNILVSMDGPKSIHDLARKYPDGTGTYDSVVSNLHAIPEYCPHYCNHFSFNAVLDTDNDYEEITKIEDDPFIKRCSVQYNFVEKEERLANYNPTFLQKLNYDIFLGYLSYYREKTPTFSNKLVEYLIKRGRLQEERISPGRIGKCSSPSGPCVPGAHRLFVDYAGRLFPCERVSELNDAMRIGDINSGFDLGSIYKMLNIAQTTEDECKSCWAFQLCSLCIKASDCHGSISSEARLEMCGQVKLNAMDLLGRLVLHAENSKHQRRSASYAVKKC